MTVCIRVETLIIFNLKPFPSQNLIKQCIFGKPFLFFHEIFYFKIVTHCLHISEDEIIHFLRPDLDLTCYSFVKNNFYKVRKFLFMTN